MEAAENSCFREWYTSMEDARSPEGIAHGKCARESQLRKNHAHNVYDSILDEIESIGESTFLRRAYAEGGADQLDEVISVLLN
jgi:hypothetical protein